MKREEKMGERLFVGRKDTLRFQKGEECTSTVRKQQGGFDPLGLCANMPVTLLHP